jgi:Tfp pilus assembly protein PilN
MKAVNLIPRESRSGGRSGVAPYVVLGVLAVLLAGVAYYVLTGNAIVERKAKLAALETQTQAAQQQAQAVEPYKEFASLAQGRVQTIRQLGQARFDWQRALADLSKVMPGNVWLSSLTGTVTTGVSIDGGSGGGGTSGVRSALPNPAIELSGCTTDHDSVVRLIAHLRLMHGVARVSLADSAKGASGSGGGGGGGASGDCRHGHNDFPQFDLVVFFDPIPAVPALSAPGASPASGAPTAAGAAVPASTPATSTTPATPSQGTTPAPAPASAATTPSAGSSGTPAANGGAG